MAGIGIAIIGGAVVGFADAGQGAASARGDVLALVGALSASGYLLLGRQLRARMSLPLYVGIVYVTAAAALFSWSDLRACACPRTLRADTSGSCSWRWARSSWATRHTTTH